MDVDRPPRQLLAQAVGQDLHVAREHYQIGLGVFDDTHQFGFLAGLGVLGDGQVDEADALTLGHRPQVQVVGDHGGDGHVHFTFAVAVEQVGEAMVELADHQQHAGRLA